MKNRGDLMSDIKKSNWKCLWRNCYWFRNWCFYIKTKNCCYNFRQWTRIGNVVKGAELAQSRDKSVEYCIIGPEVETSLKQYVVANEEEGYKVMESLLV